MGGVIVKYAKISRENGDFCVLETMILQNI